VRTNLYGFPFSLAKEIQSCSIAVRRCRGARSTETRGGGGGKTGADLDKTSHLPNASSK
jgi:hypothetical protein